jgi:PadR family transcriptional regulator, regulatory protein PadR
MLSGVLSLLVTIAAAEKARDRRRRYYSLTAEGRSVLARQRTTWRTFVNVMQPITGVDYA